jgi:predicted metal-dependent peptidase
MSKTASPQKAPAGAPVGGIDATLKLSYGRLAAGRRMPYFAGAVLSMVPREVPRGTLNTLGVTRRGVLLYDPDYIDTLTVPEMAADLLHEVSHLLRNHHDRCARIGADPKLWNSAADAEINDDLVAAKLAFKPPFVLPSQFEAEDGLMAEQYYVLLQTKVAQNQGEMPDKVGTRQCGSGAGWAGSAEPLLPRRT